MKGTIPGAFDPAPSVTDWVAYTAEWPIATKLEEELAENRRLFGCAIGAWIMPSAIPSDQCVSLFRPPRTALVAANPMMVLEDSIHHLPRGFNYILAGEEGPLAFHGVAQEPFVGASE